MTKKKGDEKLLALLDIVIDVRFEHPEKVLSPIVFTLLGIVTLVRPVQL